MPPPGAQTPLPHSEPTASGEVIRPGSLGYVPAMAHISPSEVERIADLARLELAPGEAQRMTDELEAILGYVEALERLDTTGVEPTFHTALVATPLRDDVAAAPLDPARAVANAPEHSGSAFVVPKVLDEDEA